MYALNVALPLHIGIEYACSVAWWLNDWGIIVNSNEIVAIIGEIYTHKNKSTHYAYAFLNVCVYIDYIVHSRSLILRRIHNIAPLV